MPPRTVIATAVASLVVSVAAFGAVNVLEDDRGRPSGMTEPPARAQQWAGALSAAGILDSDLDGLPDAVENFVHGTDPQAWSTSGSGLPDSWLIRYGFDPLDPAIGSKPAAKPPPDALPPAYANAFPSEFTPSLFDAYTWGRPVDWNESSAGPYTAGLDPTLWDNNGDGVPDGWLLHYDLDPRSDNATAERAAGPDGLTVREAFDHNTNPRRMDTDDDGIPDKLEIQGAPNPRSSASGPPRFPPSNPTAFSTTGSSVCDGYLVANGLDPNVPANAYGDLAHSGATTGQKYNWSRARFGAAACSSGRGLDPTRQSSTGGPIPDGWLLRFGLDPLALNESSRVTQSTEGQSGLSTQAPGKPALSHVTLTVLDEYRFGRPPGRDDVQLGPWMDGTDPTKPDTDADGLDDASEIRGYYVQWSTDVGPNAPFRFSATASDPTTADADADGLTDSEEIQTHGTDPARRDTDTDGLVDAIELKSEFKLNASRADTAVDFLRDGTRLALLQARSNQYFEDPTYEFPGEPGKPRSVAALASALPGATAYPAPLTRESLRQLFGPAGDLDGDGVSNILDPDMEGDGLLNGWEVDPALYRHSQFGEGRVPRAASDPMNPDTDGDGLGDGWEVAHGRPLFDFSPARHSLDPSRWDSDQDGTSDGQEDPDEDSAEWTRFEAVGGTIGSTTEAYQFPNLLEQQFQTDPHRFDTDKDGLGDGWKVFWGIVYAPIPPGATRPTVGVAQEDVILSSNTYRRFVLDLASVLPGEQLVQTYHNIPLVQGGTRSVHAVEGTVAFGFKQIHKLGTNPYLVDTSLDGVPDWWAHLHRALPSAAPTAAAECVAGAGLNPLIHYGDEDVDGDGLNVQAEFLRNTSPLCADTDLDGIRDGEEVHLGLDPADPSDGQRVLDETVDSDGDGLFDFREIVGVRHNHLGSGLVRTDPDLPDADGDGLLDGSTMPGQNGFAETEAWSRFFLDLGVSYFTLQQGGQRRFNFRGEVEQLTDPRAVDDSDTGVPGGWLAAHNLPATQATPSYAEQYSIGRPAWWDERVHGPWWGGVDPEADLIDVRSNNDLDGDGLEDADAGDGFEDPMPFANRLNVWRTLDWSGYPAELGLSAPPSGAHPADASLPPLVRRLLAQSYLNPRSVGGSFVHAPPPGAPPSQRQPCLELQGFVDDAGQPINVLTKGRPARLLGRVHDCAGNGFHGATVEARSGNPSQSFGAAFTDATGQFILPVNISTEHSVPMPSDVAAVLRGRTSGLVNWTADPSVVAPGSNVFLTIRSYASPAAPPFTFHRPSLASTIQSIGASVRSESVLLLKAPDAVVTGSSFEVEFKLLDSGGSPLRDPVRFTWGGVGFPPVTPDPLGQGRVVLPASHAEAGRRVLLAESLPAEARRAFVAPAEAEHELVLRRPIDIIITSSPSSADAGKSIPIKGRVFFQGRGVPQASVLFNLTSGNVIVASGAAVTGSDGTFGAALPIPAAQPSGEYTILATALPTEVSVQVETSELIRIRSIPRFTDVSTTNITQNEEVEIGARLVEPDGRGVSGAPVRVRLHNSEAVATTDPTGRFLLSLLPNLPAQPVVQLLDFAGDTAHTAATHRSERAVVAGTTLLVSSGQVSRGDPAEVGVRLTDAAGAAVGGAPIRVKWGREVPVIVLTDPSGSATYRRPGNASDALESVPVRAVYDGSRDGGLSGAVAAGSWKIIAAAEILLPSGSFDAGSSIPLGLLRDAGLGTPLSRTPLGLVRVPGGATSVVTDDDGRFSVAEAVNRTSPPLEIQVRAHFPGNPSYGPAEAQTTLFVRALTAIEASAPPTIVLGQQALSQVRVVDLEGRPVASGDVRVTLDDIQVASASLLDGQTRIPLLIPETEAPGSRVLRWSYEGTSSYAPSSTEAPSHLMYRVLLTTSIQPAEPGGASILRVTATRAGQPVPFAPIFVNVDGMGGGFTGATDENGVANFEILQPAVETLVAVRYAGEPDLTPAHLTASLVPAKPLTLVEKATRSVSWVALAAGLLLASLTPIIFWLRRNPLEPIVRRVRRILAARGPDAQQILLAYRELEEAAIGFGLLHDVAQTARILQEAIRPQLPAQASDALERLMTLFEIARYGIEPMGPEHRAQALDALDEILRALQSQSSFSWDRASSKASEVAA